MKCYSAIKRNELDIPSITDKSEIIIPNEISQTKQSTEYILYDSIYIKLYKMQSNLWCRKVYQWLPEEGCAGRTKVRVYKKDH